jgi:hypothetical protein
MLTQEKRKQFYLKMENILDYRSKCGSNAGFCSVFIVLHVLVMIKILLVLSLKTIQVMEFNGEEEHKLGIRASSTRQVFFNETKVLLKTCYLKRKRI